MFKHGKKILLGAGVLAALSFGGSALSAAGAAPVSQTPVNQAPVAQSPLSAAAQETPGTEKADGLNSKSDSETQDGAKDSETQDGAKDSETQGGSETGSEAGSQESSGSEVPGSDGAGGHADEPGNPTANHEASGQQE